MDGGSKPVVDQSGLARAIKITVGIFLFTQALSVLWQIAITVLRYMGKPTPFVMSLVRTKAFLITIGSIAIISMLTLLVCGVLFLIWLGRAHGNLARARLDDLAYRPAWAVGCYFVPVANLFVPARAMRELWNRSHGEPAGLIHAAIGEVSAWWTCTLVFWLITSFEIIKALNNDLSPVKLTVARGADGILQLFANVMAIGLMIYIARLTAAITYAQNTQMQAQSIFG